MLYYLPPFPLLKTSKSVPVAYIIRLLYNAKVLSPICTFAHSSMIKKIKPLYLKGTLYISLKHPTQRHRHDKWYDVNPPPHPPPMNDIRAFCLEDNGYNFGGKSKAKKI